MENVRLSCASTRMTLRRSSALLRRTPKIQLQDGWLRLTELGSGPRARGTLPAVHPTVRHPSPLAGLPTPPSFGGYLAPRGTRGPASPRRPPPRLERRASRRNLRARGPGLVQSPVRMARAGPGAQRSSRALTPPPSVVMRIYRTCQDFGSNLITIKFYICVSFLWLFFFF